MSEFDDKKYHFVFVTTCTTTGKSYVDFHSTDDMEDGYLGRSRLLKESVERYGVDAHQRTIIEAAPTRERVERLGAHYKKTARMLSVTPFEERTYRSPQKIETTNWWK